ncbi:transcription elongation factor GreA [Dissulfurirhabdus thermomarina]|uniref:Transcription elongation factor GreA n=1 Tax=Dissulfurirhabdus thermomarina TaxID=1765737 RepID=A0A6N9TLR2_DISTH|nr:transcription elongation factor GreA [Dissulfurirhabdus thermomarina]NDY42059.1 transcription elongation factor GreA [Dissulfurirhabdus thermomarina]NMX24533.1 transcription elongation factor GreA [Dissulfurirhabdus thermomarina]
MNRTPITREGYEKLKAELEHLEKVERYKVIKAIEEARAHGDLSENAEYHAAKERQGHIEARIQYLKGKLAAAEIIDCSTQSCDRVVFGVKVRLENLDSGEELVYQLVGPDESDVQAGRMSVTSPVGRALIGKEEGDEVEVRTPAGIRNYAILEIFT